MGSNHEPEAGTRASFVEPRVVQDSFFRVPSVPETNGGSAAQNSGAAFNFNAGGIGGRRTSPKKTPRKAPTPFHAAQQPQQQPPISPPLQEKQPPEPAQPQEFFIFKAADEKPRRTPAIRKAKARTAATPFSAATAAATGFASQAQSPVNGNATDDNEDGMAWSPSHTTTTEQPIPQQQKQQKQPQKETFHTSFLFATTDATNGSRATAPPNVGGVANEFKTQLNLDGQQQKAAAPSASMPPAPATTAPFTFSAGSPPQAAAATTAAAGEGVRPRRRGTPHRPAGTTPSVPPASPPPFVFQATKQTQAAPAAVAAPVPEVKQQQAEGFIRLSQFKGTSGAPLRRRPRTKPQQQKSSPTKPTATAAAAAAAVNGIIPPQQQQPWPGLAKPPTTTAAFMHPTQQQQQPRKPQLTLDQQAQQASATADCYRISGNESFRKQKYEDAFKQYTQALNTLMPYPTVHTQLSLLLSNRAAASLAMAKPLQALQDCRMGLHHDPNFLKCALRMATCHCRLGEYSQTQKVLHHVRKALKVFDVVGKKELETKEMEIKQSMAMMIDTLSALGYAEIQSILSNSSTANEKSEPPPPSRNNTSSPPEFLSSLPPPPHPVPKRASLEALLNHLQAHGSYFPHAEMFHAARSETLLRLGRYRAALAAVGQLPHADAPSSKGDAPWRTWIRAQIAFYQGQATQVQELLLAVEESIIKTSATADASNAVGGTSVQATSPKPPHPLENTNAIVPLPTIEEIRSIRTILQKSEALKETGNKAVGAKKYQAAIDAYTEALSSGSLSPALASILYCNRAAAHQGLGNIALAVADCCRAKALSPGYAKAHSRLATLLTELGMYSSVVDELNAAIASPDISPTSRAEYQNRLRVAKEAAAPKRTFYGATVNPPPGNHYKILGLERGCPIDQVRKSYKKLALQLHPDKSTTACRVSYKICSNSGSELSVPSTETQKRLEEGASWVFKCLGEANETLSAPEKRRELDAELSAWEDAVASGGGRGGGGHFGGFGGGGARYHQHSSYSAYGAYYRPHAQPSYNFNRSQQYGGGGGASSSSSGAGAGGGGNYRHYW